MFVRDARGEMRPVLVDSKQHQGPNTSNWTRKTTTTTKTVHGGVGTSSNGRQGGLLVTRKDTHGSSGNLTPSVFDTLPRGDISAGMIPDRSRMGSRLSNPTLSRSASQSRNLSRSSSGRRYGNGRQSDDDSPGVENVYRYRHRSTSGSRQRKRSRQPSGSRIQVYERPSSAATGWRGSRSGYMEDNFSIVSEPVPAPRRRVATPSRGGLMGYSSVTTGSNTMMSSNQYIPGGTLRNGARSVDTDLYRQNSFGRNTPSVASGFHNSSQQFIPPPSNYGGRSSSMASRGVMGSRQLATPVPGGDVTAVDPELREAEKEGNQYFISMNLNAALSRPGFAGSMNTLDQIDSYGLNGSRSRLDMMPNGHGSRMGMVDEGFHTSRLDVIDYDAPPMMLPERPASRAVSVLQIGAGEADSYRYDAGSIVGSYYNEGVMEDGYVVKSVTATKPRSSSRMSSRLRDSFEQLDVNDKVEFDLELIGLGGGGGGGGGGAGTTRSKVVAYSAAGQNGANTGGRGTALSSHSWQDTITRQTTEFPPGPEPRFTMKLNDTLLMDYLPNQGQTEVETRHETASYHDSDRSDREDRGGKRDRRRDKDRVDPGEQARRDRERELEQERRMREELELERLEQEKERMERERQALEDEKRRAEEEKRRAEEERRRAEEERKRLADELRRQKEAEEAERRRREKENEERRLRAEQEKEAERRRRAEEEKRARDLRKLEDDLAKEREMLEREREAERRRRKEEEERQKARDAQRQKEEKEREKKLQDELARERQRLQDAERERQKQIEAEEKERQRRREAEERERQKQREKEEQERRKREEDDNKRRAEDERRRKDLERQRMEDDMRRKQEEEERKRRQKEDEEAERRRRQKEKEDDDKRRRQKEKEEEEERRRKDRERDEKDRRDRERQIMEDEERARKRKKEEDDARMKPDRDDADGPAYDSLEQRTRSGYQSYANPEDYDMDVSINRGDSRDGPDVDFVRDRAMKFGDRLPETKQTSEFVRRLMKDAPPNSVRQRVDVEREEEEIQGPLPANTEGLLNLDTVSEKVNMILVDGSAELTVKVRCERIVPIRGADDLYKKSSVIVSRIIDVDLTVTQERRDLYDQVMENRREENRISNQDTFELYKAFMELAEAEEALGGAPPVDQRVRIDKRVDEERFLDLQRDRRSYGRPGDEDFVGLYEPGMASADFDTDDVIERKRQERNQSSAPPRGQSYRSERSERSERSGAGNKGLHPRTKHGKRYVRRTTTARDSDTSSIH